MMNKQSLYVLLLSSVLGVVSLLVFFSKGQGCVIRNATGIYCPGCGGKRALVQLGEGGVLYALQCNLLLIPAILVIAWILLALVFKTSMKQMIVTKRVSIVLFLVVIIYTIVRNQEGMALLRP